MIFIRKDSNVKTESYLLCYTSLFYHVTRALPQLFYPIIQDREIQTVYTYIYIYILETYNICIADTFEKFNIHYKLKRKKRSL